MSKIEKCTKKDFQINRNKLKKKKFKNANKKVTKNSIEHLELLPEQLITSKGRSFTISVALPGSILKNAQTPQLQAYLAGQVARACAVFQVSLQF